MDIGLLAAAFLENVWPQMVGALSLLLAVLASGHAILQKRDVRSAVAWVGLIWLVPVLGAVLYVLMGINRIKRRAKALRAGQAGYRAPLDLSRCPPVDLEKSLPGHEQFHALSRLVGEVVQKPLLAGNHVTPLVNGDEAYKAMLAAIDGAGQSVTLCTYIFDNDGAGRKFLDALARAVGRGVETRVVVDDVGARYSFPPITRILKRRGIKVARFLPTLIPWRAPFVNLRNHRKILVIDGRVGFTGGMNIREGHVLAGNPRHPVRDLQFRVEGPVVAHLQETFAGDWFFSTGESLKGKRWFPPLEPAGPVIARGIPDGPDEDFGKLPWTVQGALACAKSSVMIMTPYFLPDGALITSLNLAAMRGIEVDIILPSVNNLPVVHWASTHLWWQVLRHGCRIWLTPPPFDHSKLMLVDGMWMLFGSGNWDPRSFELNFEFNVECYDRGLAERLGGLAFGKLENARPVTLDDVNGRSLPVKLRDGIARLFSPYL
jgi:cardiolipin synthase